MTQAKEELCILMGEIIKKERVARNISIEALAEAVSLTPGSIELYESGQRGPTLVTLKEIAEFFNLPIDGFFYPDGRK